MTFFVVATAISATVAIMAFRAYRAEKAEKRRQMNNVEALTSSTSHYRSETDRLVAMNKGLELNATELRRINSALTEDLKILNLKVKNLESVSRTETVIKYVTRDSIVYVRVKDEADEADESDVRSFSYSDSWIEWEAHIRDCRIIEPGGFRLESRDSLTIAAEVEYKGCLFWRRPKGLKIHTIGANPYTRVNKTEYVKLKK